MAVLEIFLAPTRYMMSTENVSPEKEGTLVLLKETEAQDVF